MQMMQFKDVITNHNCPSYKGYNTRPDGVANQGCCLPLIDNPPADPGLSLTKQPGQEVIIFTCDQHLYKVTIDILFIIQHI